MSPKLGLILRLLGPAIEVVCILVLNRVGGRGQSLAGQPVEYWLYAGLALGLVLVLLGLSLSRPTDPRQGDRGPRAFR